MRVEYHAEYVWYCVRVRGDGQRWCEWMVDSEKHFLCHLRPQPRPPSPSSHSPLLPVQVTATGFSEKPIWSPATHSRSAAMVQTSPMTTSTQLSGGSPRVTPSSFKQTGEQLATPLPLKEEA